MVGEKITSIPHEREEDETMASDYGVAPGGVCPVCGGPGEFVEVVDDEVDTLKRFVVCRKDRVRSEEIGEIHPWFDSEPSADPEFWTYREVSWRAGEHGPTRKMMFHHHNKEGDHDGSGLTEPLRLGAA
jgi:hypothetical protein